MKALWLTLFLGSCLFGCAQRPFSYQLGDASPANLPPLSSEAYERLRENGTVTLRAYRVTLGRERVDARKLLPTARELPEKEGQRLLASVDESQRRSVSFTRATLGLSEIDISGTEMIYPETYDPARVRTETGQILTLTQENYPELIKQAVSAVPATPTNFKTRMVGLQGHLKPGRHRDGRIRMDFDLENTVFAGSVDYGLPICRDGVTLTPNRMLMPVFEPTKRFTGSALMREGNYLLIGPFRASRRYDRIYNAPAPPDANHSSNPAAAHDTTYLLVHASR